MKKGGESGGEWGRKGESGGEWGRKGECGGYVSHAMVDYVHDNYVVGKQPSLNTG